MRLTQTGMFHRGYVRPPQDVPPSVKIGILVACGPIGPSSSGSELRAKFVAFLNSRSVREFVKALTHVAPNASWKNLAGHGPRTLEAALTAGDDPMEAVPIASALFLQLTAGEALYGPRPVGRWIVEGTPSKILVQPVWRLAPVAPAADGHGRYRRPAGAARIVSVQPVHRLMHTPTPTAHLDGFEQKLAAIND
jgi:hypothetical protein